MEKKIHPYYNYGHPNYYLGGLIGLVTGYILAKIYQIWVVVYLGNDVSIGVLPMFWKTATTNPALLTFGVAFVFMFIGILFVRILFSVSEKKIDKQGI